jgi:hypothetical protein
MNRKSILLAAACLALGASCASAPQAKPEPPQPSKSEQVAEQAYPGPCVGLELEADQQVVESPATQPGTLGNGIDELVATYRPGASGPDVEVSGRTRQELASSVSALPQPNRMIACPRGAKQGVERGEAAPED